MGWCSPSGRIRDHAAGVSAADGVAGTCAGMWPPLLDRQSVADGAGDAVVFVVDDAIVMIETCYSNYEHGMGPIRRGSKCPKQARFHGVVNQPA